MRNASTAVKSFVVPIVIVLTLEAVAARRVSIPEVALPSPQLHALPALLGQWHVTSEQELDTKVVAYLKPDEYILRDYVNEASSSSINLFVAYFKSIQNIYGPHSPRLCLPGTGWLIKSERTTTVNVPGRDTALPVNELVMERSGDRIFVMFWYQNNRNAWAKEWHAKLRMLPDLLRYHRSDVSLVRLVTPLPSRKAGDGEDANTLTFARLLVPALADRFSGAH